MADVFLSHSSSDRDAATALEQALEGAGLSVWWDHELVSGQRFQETIVAELNGASAVVVIWSPISVKSAWVYSEARRASDQGKLVQVRTRDLDAEDLPAPFDAFHCSDVDDVAGVVRAARALVASGGGTLPADGDVDVARPQRLARRASTRRPAWSRRGLAVAGVCAAVVAIVTTSILVATGGDDGEGDDEFADACLSAADDTEPYGAPDVDGIPPLDDKYAIASPIDAEADAGRFTLQLIDTVANAPEPGTFATDAARPTLSRDRTMLLYLRTCADFRDPWIMGVDESFDHPFFSPGERPKACMEVNRPAWNAEGSKVALTCDGPKDTLVPYVFVFGSDGSLLDRFNVARPAGGPTWVGNDALVFSTVDDTERETLWIRTGMESETAENEPIRLTPENDEFSYSLPDWSQEGDGDGRLLLLRSELDIDGEPMKTGQLVWMPLQENNPQPGRLNVWSPDKTLTDPTWSPDGQSLLFLQGSDDGGAPQTLYVASFGGSDESNWKSPIDPQVMAQPAWGPR